MPLKYFVTCVMQKRCPIHFSVCCCVPAGAKSKLSSRSNVQPTTSKQDAHFSSAAIKGQSRSHGMREDPTSPRRFVKNRQDCFAIFLSKWATRYLWRQMQSQKLTDLCNWSAQNRKRISAGTKLY